MYIHKNQQNQSIDVLAPCGEPLIDYSALPNDTFYSQIEPYLPLLQRLDKQQKWQLWLVDASQISVDFVESIGLTANKIILLPYILEQNRDSIIQQALLNGNFSYILCNARFNTQASLSFNIKNRNETVLFYLNASKLNGYKQTIRWN